MISENLKYEISIICGVHIVAIIISLILLIVFFVRVKREWSLYSFCIAQLSIIFWMLFKIFKTVAPNEIIRWICIVAYYFFIYAFEVAIFNFAYSLYRKSKPRRDENLALVILAFMQFLVVLTNPIHHQFYRVYNFSIDRFGPMFYVNQGILYLLIIVSTYYGVLHFRDKLKEFSFRYKLGMTAMIVVPMIINILFLTKVLRYFLLCLGFTTYFDITPISFLLADFVFYYATFDKELIGIRPLMRHEIVSNLDTAIYVLDSSFRVVYRNDKSMDLLGNNGKKIVEDEVRAIGMRYKSSEKIDLACDDKSIILHILKVDTLWETKYVVTLDDVSEYKRMEEKIKLQNAQLDALNADLKEAIKDLENASKIGARNFVAKELHDIIGHSLVVVIKLMEVAKMYSYKDRKLSKLALDDGILALNDGIDDMANIREHKEVYNTNMLQEEISKMLTRIKTSDIKTHFNFKGAKKEISSETYDTLIRVCGELVTNSIKHARADAIFISINIERSAISISVMDDGIGCDNLVEGNGLKGIRERLGQIGGKIDFASSQNEGFMSRIALSL